MGSSFDVIIGSLYDKVASLITDLKAEREIDWELVGLITKDEKVPLCIRKLETTTGKQYVYNLPSGLCLSDVIGKQEKIENMLKSRVKIEQADNYEVIITKITSHYEQVYTLDLKESLLDGMRFNIGKCLDGKDMVLDLSGTECHTGVFGSTGSGKSVFLNVLVSQFILKDVQLRIIDLKGGVEFAMYREYPKLTHFAVTRDEATSLLENTVFLMEKRYGQLFESCCKSYKEYNKKRKNGMPCVVVLIDEYSVLDKKECKEAYKALFDLLSRARAANIICIICTQRPSHEILPGTIKCNLKNFVCFKVENETDSEIVLSEKGNTRAFKELHGEGEGLLKCKGAIREFKGYYLEDSDILNQIRHKLTNKKPIMNEAGTIRREKNNKQDDVRALEELI